MTELYCENKFCIYQEKGICTLESIELDVQGNCLDCIYITIEEKTLKELKEKLLSEL